MLGPSERAALDTQGYAVLPRALTREQVDRLRRAFEHPAAHGTQHVEVSTATPDHATWLEAARHPDLFAAAEHILGRPFRVRDFHGRNPLPGFGQQGLHADWPTRAAGDPYFVVTALFMLDDFTAENGATRVVPGSHRFVQPLPKSQAQPNAQHRDQAIVTGEAGSLLVFNGHLWHSGRRNDSAGPRRAIQTVILAHDAASPL